MSEKDVEKGLSGPLAQPDAEFSEKDRQHSADDTDGTLHDKAHDDKPAVERESSPEDDEILEHDDDGEDDGIHRLATQKSQRSIRSKLSKVASFVGSTKKKDGLARAPIPVSDLDNGVVGWDGQDDPSMPLNFSEKRKWTIIFFLSIITLMTPFASSILAPGILYLDFDFNNTAIILGSLPVSIYLLGYAAGPLVLAGLSEIYGRHIILVFSNIFFCVWQIGCALAPSLDSLIVFRLLAGIGGSACLVLGGGIIADLFPVERRGFALSIWTLGPLVGPSLGPLVGAFIAQSIGWRWDFWIVLIPAAIATGVMAVFSEETNHRVLIGRKIKKLEKEMDRTDLKSCYDSPNAPPVDRRAIMKNGLLRPLKMLALAPVLFTLSMYVAFAYGVLYLLFNTIPMVFQEGYGFTIGETGLVYIPLGLGYCIGLFIFSYTSDATIVRLTKANNDVYEPEMRLLHCIYFALLLPITFFWYGWATDKQVHWIVPTIGLVPFGIGIVGIWQPIQAYIIDAYGHYAASGLAAFTVLRSLVAAFLPLAGPSMYSSLGLGWGNSLLGFICIALIPAPLLFYRYGGFLRKRYPVKL